VKLRTQSIADAELTVRGLVDRDLATLPESFGPPSDYRPTLLSFYVDQVAREIVSGIFSDPDTTTPDDVQGALETQMVVPLKEEIFRRVNS